MHTGPGGSSVAFKSMYVCYKAARMVGDLMFKKNFMHKSK